MKRIININLSGRLIPIEDTAYDMLKSYLDSLKRFFSREEGGDEIVSDIESRIAEVFQEKLKKGAHCITDDDVNAMIAAMGRPEQLEEETSPLGEEKREAPQPEAPLFTTKRLMRDANDKVLGGVCSGIAAYYNIDPVIVRIVFALVAVAWGMGILIYIILWIILPSSRTLKNPIRKRLYRNIDNRVVGGVCSGIASYFNIDPVIPRLICIIPLLGIIFSSIMEHFFIFHSFFLPISIGFLPTVIVLYIILWLSVPKAVTLTEKLEMRGERVDLQNITNAMKGGSDEKKNEGAPSPAGQPLTGPLAAADMHPPFPEDAGNPRTTASVAGTPAATSYYLPPKRHTGLGEVLVFCLKVIGFLILAFILIVLCGLLIGVAGGFMGAAAFSSAMFPFKGLLLHTTTQHVLAWPAVFLTLGIPVVAIIWLLIKLVTGFRPRTRYVGLSLSLLWIIGVGCAIWLSISLVQDFRMSFRESGKVAVTQPSNHTLIIRQMDDNISISGGWNMFDNMLKVADDTVILNNVRLNIEKSPTDSFQVELVRASNGRSVGEAREFAEGLTYLVNQQDSFLYVQPGFPLPEGAPFRNQRIILRVMVPVGSRISVSDNTHLNRWWNHGNWDNDWNGGEDWDYNTLYQMTPDGLEDVNKPAGQDREQDNERDQQPTPPEPPAPEEPSGTQRDTGTGLTVEMSPGMSTDGLSSIFYMLFDLPR